MVISWAATRAFAATPWGKRIGVALLIAAVAIGIYVRGRSDGAESKAESIGKEIIEPLRKQMQTDREKLSADLSAKDAALATKDSLIALKDEAIAKQQSVIAGLDKRIAQIDVERRNEQQRIAALTDAEVILDLARQLGWRDPTDKTPTLYPAELRRADTIVADYAKLGDRIAQLESKSEAQAQELAEQRDKLKLTEDKLSITEGKLAAALAYIEKSDARFKDAYNVFQRAHPRPMWQKVLSLGLLRDRRINELVPITAPEKPAELRK